MNQIPDSEFNAPRSSFMSPVPVPASDPETGTLISVIFNADWLPYVLGCLWQLWQPTTWASDDPAVIQLAINRAINLTYLFTIATEVKNQPIFANSEVNTMSDLIDVQCDADGKCWLVYRCDICSAWNKVMALNSPPAITPPTPQPDPGACGEQDILMVANQKFLTGIFVSSGDTVTVADPKGAWNDGGSLDWWCPTAYRYTLGACNSTDPAPVTGSDPLVTGRHMLLIASDGTNYYDAIAGFTVSAGVNNQPLTFQANDSAIGNDNGSAQFHVKVCKSSTPPAADGVYWATWGYPLVGYPTWTKIPFGVTTTLTSAALGSGNGTDIWISWVSGGLDINGQPVNRGLSCFNLLVANFTGYVNAPSGSYRTPCASCAPGSTITPSSSFPLGEYADMQIAAFGATFSVDVVIGAC
jgi:hypothetical protein